MTLAAHFSLAPSHSLCQLLHSDHKPHRMPLVLLNLHGRKYQHSYVVRSVLNGRTLSDIHGNEATEPARILLERLFAQTQKLEEQIAQEPCSAHAAELSSNLLKLEPDLHAALSALKRKEKTIQQAEMKVLSEINELNLARQDLERGEEEIAVTGLKQEKLEEDLRLANLELASQTTEIRYLNISLKERGNEISALQSALSCKEGEIVKMKHELTGTSEKALSFELEFLCKSRLVEETNNIVEKQKTELAKLQSKIRMKKRELEILIGLQKGESEKLKPAEAKLEKQAMDWLVLQEEFRKLSSEASKSDQGINENGTMEEFGRVRKLFLDVRAELVSSREALVLSREKVEGQDKLLRTHLSELEEQRAAVMSYLMTLRDAKVEVDSERIKLKLADARNKELKRSLALEKDLVEELQKELENERSCLEQAVNEKSSLQEDIQRKMTAFEELQRLLEAKQSELVEARLEIQLLKSKQCSLRLALEAKDSELSDTKISLGEMNREISELKEVLLNNEDELNKALFMLKEKDELMDTNFKCSEADSVVGKIVDLTKEILNDGAYAVLSPLELENVGLSTDGFKWQIKRLEAELEFTRESLRAKEIEVVTAQKDLVIRDEELRMLVSELNSREKEITVMKEEIVQENDLRRLYSLEHEMMDKKNVGSSDKRCEEVKSEVSRLFGSTEQLVREEDISSNTRA